MCWERTGKIYLEDTAPLINAIGAEPLNCATEEDVEDFISSLIDYSVHKEDGEPPFEITDSKWLDITREVYGIY